MHKIRYANCLEHLCDPELSGAALIFGDCYLGDYLWVEAAAASVMAETGLLCFHVSGKLDRQMLAEKAILDAGLYDVGRVALAMGKGHSWCEFWLAAKDQRPYKNYRFDGDFEAGQLHWERSAEALEGLVGALTKTDDLVVDLGAGHGNLGVACIRSGRHYLGFEQYDCTLAEANQRLAKARGGL